MCISIRAAHMSYEQNSWLFESEDAALGCVRGAPLPRGLVVKSGHKQVFPPPPPPPSIFLSILPSPVCLPPRFFVCFFFFTSLLQPTSLHFPRRQIPFYFSPSSVFTQASAKPKHLPVSLSSLIAFHPSPSFSLSLSLSFACSPVCVSLSMLISLIRL